MKLFKSKDFYSVALAVVLSLAVVAISASAATTISTSISTGGTLDVAGATELNGGLTMDTDKFTVANTSGNTSIGGTLAVTGASTLTGYLGATSTAGFSSLASFYGGFISSASSTVSGALTAAGYLGASSTAGFTGLSSLYGGFISSASSTVNSTLTVSGVFQASSTALFGSGGIVIGTTTRAIKIGDLSSTVPGSGVGLTDSVTKAVEVNADDNDTARSTGIQGIGVRSRLMIYADNSTEDWAVDGLTKYSAVAKNQNISAGVMGRWESTGATTLIGSGWGVAGVIGRIGTEAAVAISDGARAAALMAFGNNAIGNAFTGAGKYVGLWVLQSSTATMDPFDYGIEIQNDAATVGVKIGTATTDIELQGGDTIRNLSASSTAMSGRLGVASSTPSKTLDVAGSALLTSTGTTTVNVEATTAGQGSCIQLTGTDGANYAVYATASSTNTGHLVVEVGRCN